MSQYSNNSILSKLTLGKATDYSQCYDPNLLQGVPRTLNREQLSITADSLPFYGEDVWYGYELSWLNNKGKPVVAVAEFRFSCTSVNIVESKSFKLYLNSFNQSCFSTWQDVQAVMIKDLTNIVEGDVKVTLFNVEECPALAIMPNDYICIDEQDIEITNYQLDPEHLKFPETNNTVSEKLVSHLLKSNCLITNQPDWASIYIEYQGNKICHQALLKYLISFRQHNEFHEQCVERIFIDLMNYCQLESLTVFARYTRRGGLDINPYRSTKHSSAPNLRTLRQ
ncbi:NADPH-dependent 7-cyano-7-deazaguanine reductase QueF [Thalassotalea profundi]|uniref:NADPH-dependent 7-cyano-7-deazaguanine reductase n=1 Tax=Thalassotalea profundi TaxID=2036687 RepID=A0ABQ3IL48_9GAMM|nr:NADPH-dependent 7-cyano-7-deazaguanine reductase QueF [Thalassotalea profundi]GHE85236.1 NADPH-dependent 7-cyano-7-deazaguanine reductase [Thalassotalea profundi]